MLYFCTYLDSNYLVRFLPMYWSLLTHCRQDFCLHVLCWDDDLYRILSKLNLDKVVLSPFDSLLKSDNELYSVRGSRSKVEFYFTCTAAWCIYVLQQYPQVDRLTYLDSDLYFFSTPDHLFDGQPWDAILVSSHKFKESNPLCVYGKYNVAFLSFPRSEEGMACLTRWRHQCIEWCYDRCEGGKFADQKYLDEWPHLYSTFVELTHPGANVGPWCIGDVSFSKRCGRLLVDGEVLVFYHFEKYNEIAPHFVDPGLVAQQKLISKKVINNIHCPYVQAVLKAKQVIRSVVNITRGCALGNTRSSRGDIFSTKHLIRRFVLGHVVLVVCQRAYYVHNRFLRRLVSIYDAFVCRKPIE